MKNLVWRKKDLVNSFEW